MKNHTLRRLAAAALTLALTLPCVLPARAAGRQEFSDLPASHWAYTDMLRCAELGLLSGTGEGMMSPDASLTWAQYFTMIARAFNGRAFVKKLDKGTPWDIAGYEIAQKLGLVEKGDDVLIVDESTLHTPLTRRDVAVLLTRALPRSIEGWYDPDDYPMSDIDDLDRESRKAVERMVELGLTKGKGDGTFGPDDTLRRCDGSVMLLRALEHYDDLYAREEMEITLTFVDEEGNILKQLDDAEAYVCQSYSYLADLYMPAFHYYVGEYGYVSSACESYTLTLRPMDEYDIEESLAWEAYYKDEITYEQFIAMDFWLRQPGSSYRKCELLFGDPERWRFSSQQEASAAMARVTIPVWKLNGNKKVSSTATLTVHGALAEDVVAIFTEIYNDPSQFPIHDIGGFSWRGDTSSSEHNCGTAIDINANENYQVSDGRAMVGSFWKPGENPYSIAKDGIVVKTFEKYGWTWGGNAWDWGTDPNVGYHDFMHFSYLGG